MFQKFIFRIILHCKWKPSNRFCRAEVALIILQANRNFGKGKRNPQTLMFSTQWSESKECKKAKNESETQWNRICTIIYHSNRFKHSAFRIGTDLRVCLGVITMLSSQEALPATKKTRMLSSPYLEANEANEWCMVRAVKTTQLIYKQNQTISFVSQWLLYKFDAAWLVKLH